MKQKVFSWKDKFTIYDENGNNSYSIEITDDIDPVPVIAVVLIINAILVQSNNNGVHISFGI